MISFHFPVLQWHAFCAFFCFLLFIPKAGEGKTVMQKYAWLEHFTNYHFTQPSHFSFSSPSSVFSFISRRPLQFYRAHFPLHIRTLSCLMSLRLYVKQLRACRVRSNRSTVKGSLNAKLIFFPHLFISLPHPGPLKHWSECSLPM